MEKHYDQLGINERYELYRWARRVKTDRIDVENLRHTVIAWCRGERHVCSMVAIPSVEEKGVRRTHRERDRLVRERTAHINRIKDLMCGQGIRVINVKKDYKITGSDGRVTGDGRPLPERLSREITREIERLAQIQAQIVEVECERDKALTACVATERQRHQLPCLKGVGPTLSATLTPEVYYRQPANRRQIASYIGITPGAYDSGDGHRKPGSADCIAMPRCRDAADCHTLSARSRRNYVGDLFAMGWSPEQIEGKFMLERVWLLIQT